MNDRNDIKSRVKAAENTGAATALPPKESAEDSNGFINFGTLHSRIPLCERSLRDAIRKGLIPSVVLPGGRRRLFFWPAVREALLRRQRGAE